MKRFVKLSLAFALAFVCQVSYSQTHVEPPMNYSTSMFGGNKSAGIVADKQLADGNRIVYGNTFRMTADKVDGGKTIYYVLVNPFAINKSDTIMYGFSIVYSHHTAVEVLDNATVLLKMNDGTIIKTVAPYGCGEESHNSTSFSPNLTGGATIARNNTRHNITAHVLLTEQDYLSVCNSELVKIRLATSTSSIDFEVKGKKFCKYMSECYPLLKESISKESEGIESGF